MSSNRTERLLNLVICLLATNQWLPKERIRLAVPQYADCESDAAFDRMFERDKEDLRDLGIPVRTGSHSDWFDDEAGYRIDRNDYQLPPISLTPAESAALGLAGRVWQQASLAGPASRALVKLSALGVPIDDPALSGLQPRIRATEPSFDTLYQAARDRAPVGFDYRRPGGELIARRVEPWALSSRGGWWYLVGHDRLREAPRAFRLSRIEGVVRRIGPAGSITVPDRVDLGRLLPSGGETDGRTARLRLRPGRGAALRLRAKPVTDGSEGRQVADQPGWDLVELEVGDRRRLAEEVAGLGPDAVAESPEDVRDAVIALLQGAAQSHQSRPLPQPNRTGQRQVSS